MDGQASASVLQLSTFTTVRSIPRKDKFSDFWVNVHVVAPTIEVHQQYPVDIVAVVDISGSMTATPEKKPSKTRMDVVKEAMRNVIQKFGASNRLAVVPFNSDILRGTSLMLMDEQGRKTTADLVNSLWAHYSTNFSVALDKAVKILDGRRPAEDKDRLPFIIFLSDGEDPDFKPEKIEKKYPIHTFGISADHKPQTLQAMAELTSGSYTPITEDLEKITEKLAQLTERLTSVVAVDVRIDLMPAHPGVSLSRVKSNDDKFKSNIRDDKKSGEICVPSLSSGEVRDFFVYLDVPEGDSDADVMEVLTVGGAYAQSLDNQKVDIANLVVSVARPTSPDYRGDCKELEWIEERVQYWCKVKLDLSAMYEKAEAEMKSGAGNADAECQRQVVAAFQEASMESINRAMYHDIYTATVYAVKLKECRCSGETEKVPASA